MRDLEEAEAWLDAAKFTAENAARGAERYTVAAAHAVHALIRANDALTFRFLRKRSTRHEDAAGLFGDLAMQNKIDPKYAGLRTLLVRAAAEKSDFDYKGAAAGKEVAGRWIRETEKFIEMLKDILGP